MIDGGDKISFHHRGASITVSLDHFQSVGDEDNSQSPDEPQRMDDMVADVFNDDVDDKTIFDRAVRFSGYYRDRFTFRDYLKGFVVLGLCWPFAEIVQHFYSLSGSSINLFLTAILTVVLAVLFLMAAFIVLYPTLLVVSVLLLVAIPFNLVLPNNPMGLANNGMFHFLFASAVIVYYRFVDEYY
jgi:hypothetical protein